MTTFTSEDREMAAKHDGIESPHNTCCYKDKCRHQQAEIEALKEDGKKLDWIWKQASKISGGGVFQIKGIELFTVVTQHIINTKGIRELLDSAMEIDAREKASKR